MDRYAHYRPLARQDQPRPEHRRAARRRSSWARHRLPNPRTPRPRHRFRQTSPVNPHPPHFPRRATVPAGPAPSTAIRLTSNDKRVPTDNRNTAWKMVALALDSLGVQAEVAIHIEKRLPVQGVVAAGSANAIAALIGLETELSSPTETLGAPGPGSQRTGLGSWGGGLASETWERKGQKNKSLGAPSIGRALADGWNSTTWPSRRLALAAQVGSDVPLFLIGGAIIGLA